MAGVLDKIKATLGGVVDKVTRGKKPARAASAKTGPKEAARAAKVKATAAKPKAAAATPAKEAAAPPKKVSRGGPKKPRRAARPTPAAPGTDAGKA